MRVVAILIALVLGASAALAQADHKSSFGPVAAAAAPAKAKPKSKAERKQAAAAEKAKAKAERDAAADAAGDKPAKGKSSKDRSAKDKPVKEDKSAQEDKSPKSKSAQDKQAKDKSAKAGGKTDAKTDPATVGAAAAAAQPATPDLRDAYSAIPLAERVAIQSNLIWTGDYNGLINGEYSERLVEAVKTYQKRHKSKITGVLGQQEREALATDVRPKQLDVGWRLLEDPVTGARVGLPSKLATLSAPAQSGTRWSSAQGQLQIETFRVDTGATLEALFEQQKKESARRRIKYSVLRPDYFVVSGMQGLKKFYVRTFAQNDELRGITILYDQAMEGTMDPIVVAMSSAFVPFATYAVANASQIARPKVEYGTGLVVSASGHIVAARRLVDGCQVISIPRLGNAERLAEDKDGELALLRVYGAHGLQPIGLPATASAGKELKLVGIADPQSQAGGAAITAVPAKLGVSGHALDAAPALGFSGAAALNSQGHFVGVAVQKPAVVAGAGGAPAAAVVPAEAVRSFLRANDVTPAAARPGEDVRLSVVRVICVRK